MANNTKLPEDVKAAQSIALCQILPPYQVPLIRHNADKGHFTISFKAGYTMYQLDCKLLSEGLDRYIDIVFFENF